MISMPYKVFRLNDFEDFHVDYITSLIINTQINKEAIISDWSKLVDFVLNNPSLDLVDELGEKVNGNLSKIKIKDEYVIDSFEKIILQIKHKTKNFNILEETVYIFYYSYEPNKNIIWAQEHIELGQVDSEGSLNYGSCTFIKSFSVNWKLFIQLYNQKFN